MHATFAHILVPVDFSLNTELAVRKAVELGGEENVLLHLFHVERTLTTLEAKLKLNLIKSVTEERWPWVRVRIHVDDGSSVTAGIIAMARLVSPELIVIGKHGGNRYLPLHAISPQYLAKATRVPVMTVKPGSMDGKIKIVVIPVRDVMTERKLEIALTIAQRYRARIHLVTTQQVVSSRAFVNTYRQLREFLGQRVEYHADARRNLVKATVRYAESIMADLILADPETESSVLSWIGRTHISHLLKQGSRVQIMDVA
ncbi:MAG TPA: universal stress protein [Dinghuibacter sp.]|uniref:universal stress protein n=1 Tax=Dinghuibacter sp. TaxID=2024697 RepID=UPI002C7BCC11|nr:universal stress protein [Dinghuibacter sp.]HTJ13896.1 universal stress protein [Dinghuibacter sp.]